MCKTLFCCAVLMIIGCSKQKETNDAAETGRQKASSVAKQIGDTVSGRPSDRIPLCSKSWNDIPSPTLERLGVISKSINYTDSLGYQIPFPCSLKTSQDKGFFLLIPGIEPQELQGNMQDTAGRLCTQNDPSGPFPFARLIPKNGKVHNQTPSFVLYGDKTEIRQCKLSYIYFNETKNDTICMNLRIDRDKYDFALYSTPKDQGSFFFAEPGDCIKSFWGYIEQNECIEVAHALLDCPEGGPTAKQGYGKPVGILRLRMDGQTEKYILIDSSFWEFIGHSIIPIADNGIPIAKKTRDVFEDMCESH